MAPVAMTFAVLDSGGSVTDLGLVFTAGIIPTVLFLVGGGVVADRLSRRVVMLTADVACGVVQVVFAVLVFTGSAQLWSMALLAAARGAAAAFYQPALAAMPTELVPAERLQRANSLLGLAKSVPDIAGPAVAGVLVALGGSGVVLLIDGATYLISALFLAGVRVPAKTLTARAPLWHDLREGWVEFRSRRWLWTGVLQFALWNMAVMAPFLVLGPMIAKQDLGGAWAWGLISAAQGAGAVVAGVLLLRWRVRRPLVTITVARLSWVFVLGFLALRLPAPVVAVAALAVGFASGTFLTVWRTTEQTLIPRQSLARVSSYDLLGAFALGPVGLAVVGPISGAVGLEPVLWFAAAWQLVSSAVLLLLPDVRGLRLDVQEAARERT
ncbi:MAG: MFS transporter [Saccharothrix sp.]|nr:MFS transporter [Saccharothrix sp.]